MSTEMARWTSTRQVLSFICNLYSLCSIPYINFALLLQLPPFRSSNPGSHSWHFPSHSTLSIRIPASQALLSRMRLTLHATRRTPHGASRLVLAMSSWSVKTRRAPSRHCSDARGLWSYDCGYAWHEYTPPPYYGARLHVYCAKTSHFLALLARVEWCHA